MGWFQHDTKRKTTQFSGFPILDLLFSPAPLKAPRLQRTWQGAKSRKSNIGVSLELAKNGNQGTTGPQKWPISGSWVASALALGGWGSPCVPLGRSVKTPVALLVWMFGWSGFWSFEYVLVIVPGFNGNLSLFEMPRPSNYP